VRMWALMNSHRVKVFIQCAIVLMPKILPGTGRGTAKRWRGQLKPNEAANG
jgi:hypothetical protein